jgi:uncharacterized phage protein gp47/JayE
VSYFAPYIDAAGVHINTFADIQANLIAQAQSIFGSDIYLGNDSQDMQMIANEALYIYNLEQLAVKVYNNQSPVNAAGTGLDSIVKLNGLARSGSTYSTCIVSLIGIAGMTIAAGVVQDSAGYKWDLPVDTIIPSGGSISVIATCETAGAVVAGIGTINVISTPQYGWTSVSNVVAATAGSAIETDAALKARQAASVALPSQTILDGIVAAVLKLSGVARAKGYENVTGSTDSNTLPAHSISLVVDGGTDAVIANTIYLKKAPGVPTYGSTTVNVTESTGFVIPISFYHPTVKPIDVAVTVKGLTGYSSTITDSIKAAVVAYLNSLQIGDDVYWSSLLGAALSAQPNVQSPAFSVTALTFALHGGSLATSDVVIAFNAVAQGVLANVTVTVT